MIKKLIVTATLLLIHNTPEAIQYTRAILNFIILAQYVLHDNKTLHYMEYALYRLNKIKIAFEHHRPIDSKLCWLTFNYPKFHAISHFVHYIWDYGNMVNYNIAHSKAVYKYLLKAFYNRIKKKEYDLQIWQHNIRHTNIIAMKDVIIEEKAREKKRLSKNIANTIALAEVARALNLVDHARKYMCAMNNANMDAAKKLGLTSIKKY